MKRFEARTGHRILERYGMTETNMNTSNPYDGERRAGTVGFPLPGVELKITDPDSGDMPPGEIGQIEVRGPNVFKGYWQMPEKTAEELRADGFFITGDLGRIDADGYVHIVGRNKDLIISGGYNIYPKEIELILDEQPGVLESAVIGVPHPDFGETVLGLIVPRPEPRCHRRAVSDLDSHRRGPAAQHDGQGQKNLLREEYARSSSIPENRLACAARVEMRPAAQHHGQGPQTNRHGGFIPGAECGQEIRDREPQA
jgi:acyl-CoA synthetase (AMP-forming)/AMP-acid ligase II